MTLALTERDHALIHAAWSLGLATSETLRQLVSPQTSVSTLRDRIRLLRMERYLTQTRYVAPRGALWLYGAGSRSRQPGERRSWRPSLAQVEHTLAVGDAVAALTRPAFGGSSFIVSAWQGEAEIRSWARPGHPFPDARVMWRSGSASGAWCVEVDRATESGAAWRRKLVRYATFDPAAVMLVLTSTRMRAANIASLAADVGTTVFATTLTALTESRDPPGFHSGTRCELAFTELIAAPRR